jgi:septal ring factor EnvC (AmiA/AmiB activator)
MINLVVCAALPILAGAAANQDLDRIKKKIASEKKDLSRLKSKESSALESLGKIQTELDQRNREIALTSAKLEVLTNELRAKETEAARLSASADLRRKMLYNRAAALYRWRRAGSPLIVLNGDISPATLLRRQRYLQAALTFDRDLLDALQEEGHRHAAVQHELAQKRQELVAERQLLDRHKEAARLEAQKKQALVASLRREQHTRLSALKEMEAAALRLEKMMEELARRARAKRDAPALPSPGVGLEALRGRLEWPVRGRITAPFGKYKHPEFAAEIVRKGIDIEAPDGAEIRAVENGRVVYAEHFSGYGRMIIVDHGERYYTIYGHLFEIIKKTGETVSRGEVLGRAGDSDSLNGAKLYFEIRKDGHSVDPIAWLRKR